MQITTTVNMTEEEYIQFELKSDIRHEYINGQLMDMPGESGLNNMLAGNLFFILKTFLRNTPYAIFTHDTKLAIPNEQRYFYPDLFISTEDISAKKYVYRSAILIAEVLSTSTRSYDAFDKFIQYKKLADLKYYFLIEPVKKVITLFSKNENNEWQIEIFNGAEEWIELPAIQIKFKLADLYQ